MLTRAPLALVLAATAALAQSGSKSLVGADPPSLKDPKMKSLVTSRTEVDLSAPGASGSTKGECGYSLELADHKGKVVLIYFFKDDAESAREGRVIGALHQKHRDHDRDKLEMGKHKVTTYKNDRLVVIAVTPDKGSDDKKISAFVKGTYAPLQVLISDEIPERYGVTSYPRKFLIDKTGKVALEGRFTVEAIEQRIAEMDEVKAENEPPKKDGYSDRFAAALKAAGERDYSKAVAEASKLEKLAAPDGDDAKAFVKWIEELGPRRLAAADWTKEGGDVFSARDAYAAIEKQFPSRWACTKEARAKNAALKAEQKKLFSLEKTWNDALAAEKANDAKKAIELFRKCGKSAPGTPFADRCEDHAVALEAK